MKSLAPRLLRVILAQSCSLALVVGSITSSLAQEKSPAPKADSPPSEHDMDRRLERIEKQLQELMSAVKELQNRPVDSPGSPRAPASESKGTKPLELGVPWLQTLSWRSIGPANMSGRTVDFAVVESDPCTYWVA